MKNIALLFFVVIFHSFAFSQKASPKTALIIIDIQDFYFPGGRSALEEPEAAAQKAALILNHFRQKGVLVVHIRHESEQGGDIHRFVSPLPNEKVITKKEVNAFLKTDLLGYLREHNISNLVLCGMQTHLCLEAATRAAHDLGFNCTVIADACATRDVKFGDIIVKAADVHASTLSTLQRSYAKVVKAEEFIKSEMNN